MKKKLCSLLAATLILSSSMAMSAQEVSIQEIKYPVLTFEQAIREAKKASVSLNQNERQQEFKAEQAQMTDFMYGYEASEAKYLEKRYTQEQQSVIEKQIERDVRALFDDIIYNEKYLDLLEDKISLQEKLLTATQLKKEKEVVSEFDLKKAELQLKNLQEEKRQLEITLEKEYASLSMMIGKSAKKYTLEKKENTYEAYSYPGNIETLASLKAEQHLAMWKAKEDIKLEGRPDYNRDYEAILQRAESREQARDNERLTEQKLKEQIRAIYLNVKQIETNYEMAKKNLFLKEKEMKVNELYLANGTLSQVDYENQLLGYRQSKLELEKMINQHVDQKELLNRPYLISIR